MSKALKLLGVSTEGRSEASYLSDFLPDALVRRFRFSPDLILGAEVDDVQVAVLFADISGFTPLAERLYREFKEQGHEKLTSAINAYFDALIDIIHQWGGEVVKFLGDAVITVWTEIPGKRPMDFCAMLATRCAMQMATLQATTNTQDTARKSSKQSQMLRIKVGIGVGRVHELIVGGVQGRWEYLLAGETLNQAFDAEKNAEKGDVLVSQEVYDKLLRFGLKATRVESKSATVYRAKAFKESFTIDSAAALQQRSLERGDLPQTIVPVLRGFVPQPVLAELDTQQGRSRDLKTQAGELRTVTVMFVHLPTLEFNFTRPNTAAPPSLSASTNSPRNSTSGVVHVDMGNQNNTNRSSAGNGNGNNQTGNGNGSNQNGAGANAQGESATETGSVSLIDGFGFVHARKEEEKRSRALKTANDALRVMQEIILKYEGWIRQFVIDDKGSVLICVFGCPGAAHEDDSFRAVTVAQLIQRQLIDMQLVTSIGITTGNAFCGIVGQTSRVGGRCDYAIVGDVVNLSARLMANANGMIFCDEDTVKRVGAHIKFKRLPLVKVKGKSNPIPVFQPAGKGHARENRTITKRLSEMSLEGNSMFGRDKEFAELTSLVNKVMLPYRFNRNSSSSSDSDTEKQALNSQSHSHSHSQDDGPAADAAGNHMTNGNQFNTFKEMPSNSGQRSTIHGREGDRVVLVEGPQGIGKTCLVDSLVHHATMLEIPYVYATGDRVERSTPFFIWSSIMSTMLSDAWTEAYPRRIVVHPNHTSDVDETPRSSSADGHAHTNTTHKLELEHARTNLPPQAAIPRIPALGPKQNSTSSAGSPKQLSRGPSTNTKHSHDDDNHDHPDHHDDGDGDGDDDDDIDDQAVKHGQSSDDDVASVTSKDHHKNLPTKRRIMLAVPNFAEAIQGSSSPHHSGSPSGSPRSFSGSPQVRPMQSGLRTERLRYVAVDLANSELVRNAEVRLGVDAAQYRGVLLSFLGQIADDRVDLKGQARMDATRSMLYRLLSSFVDADNPLLLVFEDVQNMDALSLNFIARECSLIRNLLIVMTCRAEELSQNSDLHNNVVAMRTKLFTTVINLGPLSDSALKEVMAHKIGVADIPDEVADAILHRAEGNPYLAQEMITQLVSLKIIEVTPDGIDINSNEQLSTIVQRDLPTSVEQIFRSRIDALPPNLQLALKIASVVVCAQPSFSLQLMTFLHLQELTAEEHRDMLDKLKSAGFIHSIIPADMDSTHLRIAAFAANNISTQHLEETIATNPHYVFTAKVCQQAAYEMMLFGQRKSLHVRLARFYERALGRGGGAKVAALLHPILALHYERAEMWSNALDYHEKAAMQYINQHARASTIEVLNTMLKICSDAESSGAPIANDRLARWHRLLAQAYSGTGHYQKALTHFNKVLTVLGLATKEGFAPHVMRKLTSSSSLPSITRRKSALPAQQQGAAANTPHAVATITDETRSEDLANNGSLSHRSSNSPEQQAKMIEAAHSYFGLFDLYVNHLYSRSEALFVAARLEHTVIPLCDPLWTCVSSAVRCNANILANAPRTNVITLARSVVHYLRMCEHPEEQLLVECTMLITRSLLAVCNWRDLEEAVWIAATLLQRAVHQRKLMQNNYVQAVYFHAVGCYRNAQGALNQVKSYCDANVSEVDLAVRCFCSLVSVSVRFGDPNRAYEHFCQAATIFFSSGGTRTHDDTLFDIAAAGALALTALHRIEHSIPYLALCFRWCCECARPYHTFQFVALRQFSEAILNTYWVVNTSSWELDTSLEFTTDPILEALTRHQTLLSKVDGKQVSFQQGATPRSVATPRGTATPRGFGNSNISAQLQRKSTSVMSTD